MAGFALAEAFVTIGANTASFSSGLKNVKASLTSLQSHFTAISDFSKKLFIGLAGAFAFFVKGAGDAEDADIRLRSAIATLGVEVDSVATDLDKFADAIEEITVVDGDLIKTSMASAVALGVQADQLKAVTQAGVGLGERFFNGDTAAGIQAVALATQGNFRALQKLVPGLKDATSAQAKLALVQKEAEKGFQQAQDRAKGLNGSLIQLWHVTTRTFDTLGNTAVPALKSAVRWMEAVALKISQLTPEQANQVVKWGAIAAAVAGVVALAPSIVAFGTIVTTTLGIVGNALLGLSKIMLALVTSPLAIMVGGFVAGFALMAGEGDDWTSRLINGFKQIGDWLNRLLGSWQGFTTGIGILWDQSVSYVAQGMTQVGEWLMNGFQHVAEAIEQTWWNAFETMFTVWEYLKSGAQQFLNWLTSTWDSSINTVSDKLIDAYTEIKGLFSSEDEKQATKRYLDDSRRQSDAAAATDLQAAQQAANDEYQFKAGLIAKNLDAQRQADRAKRESNRRAITEEANQTLGALEIERQKKLEAGKAAFNALPKLSDSLKGGFDAIGKALGLDKAKAAFEGILKLGEDAKKDVPESDPLKLGAGAGKGKIPKLQREGIEETFKNMSALRLFGGRANIDPQQQQLGEQKKTNAKLDKLIELQGGKKAGGATFQ